MQSVPVSARLADPPRKSGVREEVRMSDRGRCFIVKICTFLPRWPANPLCLPADLQSVQSRLAAHVALSKESEFRSMARRVSGVCCARL